jgi:diguanylate cyclase (GGDEF)-like protein
VSNMMRTSARLHRMRPDTQTANATTSARFNHLQELFDKSFKAARIGIWECSLPDEVLTWTDTVYELFDLEPQCALSRDDIVALYTDESRRKLSEIRSATIAAGNDFTLDAEIITATGNRRWIRITAIVERVEGRPVRLFGMKQDITAEKTMMDHIRHLAEVDTVTGLASRAKFEGVFEDVYAAASEVPHALLLIDLDGFKAVNDSLGHQAGDACLKEAGHRLTAALPDAIVISRLGGDEFAVLHPCRSADCLEQLGNRIVKDMQWQLGTAGLRISSSVGGAPVNGDIEPKDVFSNADRALYRAKSEGKNSFRLFEAGQHHHRR